MHIEAYQSINGSCSNNNQGFTHFMFQSVIRVHMFVLAVLTCWWAHKACMRMRLHIASEAHQAKYYIHNFATGLGVKRWKVTATHTESLAQYINSKPWNTIWSVFFDNRHNKILRPNVTSLLGFISLNHSLEFPFTHAVHKPNSPHLSKVHTYKLLSCICIDILLELDQQLKRRTIAKVYTSYI